MANTSIQVTDLDFNEIKASLKNFLSNQSAFSGYDFSGSGLDVLLDILAYNTHYNAYYLNMVANESFLDTALLRNSVVSHAKKFHYIPRSSKAPRATVKLVVTPKVSYTSETLVLPNLKFLSEQIDGTVYNFTTLDSISATKANGVFTFNNVTIYEGEPASYSFTVDTVANPKQMFTINDATIDTDTLAVSVQESVGNSSTTIYTKAPDVIDVLSTDTVFFLQEGQDTLYQIYFGDDVIGKSLSNGNIVQLTYLLTNGDASNFANNFTLISSIAEADSTAVTPVAPAAGGALRETVDEIKFAAPLQFLSGNRAVTKFDYIKLIQERYPFFEAVNVWGGEENDPPVYGKVFISAKPRGGFEVTETEKEYVKENIIKPMSVMTVTPEIVDVDYNYIRIRVEVYYDPRKTSIKTEDLRNGLRNLVLTFCNSNLNQFNSYFGYSALEMAIQNYSSAIVSNEVNVLVEKRFRPNLLISATYNLSWGMPLARGSSARSLASSSIASDNFSSGPSFEYLDSLGISRRCYLEEIPSSYSGLESVVITNPGIDYTETPTVEIVGDGTGATAVATIVNSRLNKIDVLTPGIGYTTAAVRIVGGGGNMGAASAVLEGRYGNMRIYYYKPDSVTNTNTKNIINQDKNGGVMGTIDYVNGTVILNDFNPISVDNDFGDIRISARPTINIIKSDKNKMLVLDPDDSSSVLIELTPITT